MVASNVFGCLAPIKSDDISIVWFYISCASSRKVESSSLDILRPGVFCLIPYHWHFVRAKFCHLEIPSGNVKIELTITSKHSS